jgi:hypothetical protein
MGKGTKNLQKTKVEGGMDEENTRSARLNRIKRKVIQKKGKKNITGNFQKKKINAVMGMDLENKKDHKKMKAQQIRLKIKTKKEVKSDPQMLKSFNERFETESRKFLDSKKFSKGQKKRLKRKVIFVGKKMLGPYVEEKALRSVLEREGKGGLAEADLHNGRVGERVEIHRNGLGAGKA